MNKGQMSRHTAVVLLANTASLIFGLLATVAVAHYFGSGRTVDALFIALSVPQVAGQILLSVALVAIVPVYARYRSESDRVTAQRQIAPVFYASALILGVLSLGVVFAAPLFIQILAPGFDAAAHREAVMLLRWMSPLVLLLGLSGLLQGIQNADHSFACPAWSKLLPTAFALLLLAVFAARAGVVAYAWGMLVGAAAGLAWQFALVYRSGGFAPRLKGIAAAAAHLRVGLAAIFGARIMGQAGVGGLQSFTLVVRGMALGEITGRQGVRMMAREGVLGMTQGVAVGGVVTLIAGLWQGNWMLGIITGVAMVANMFIASVVGTGIPLFLRRVGVDPAVASAVFITTVTDVVGAVLTLGLAALLIERLL